VGRNDEGIALRVRAFADLTAGVALLPLVALGMYLVVAITHDSIAEIGRLAAVLESI